MSHVKPFLVFVRFPIYSHLDRQLSRWWAWLERNRANHYAHGIDFHSIDYTYCTAGPDRARNVCVLEFLKSPATHLWMIDCDVVPPLDLRLLEQTRERDLAAVSGVYDRYWDELGIATPQVYMKSKDTLGKYVCIPPAQWPEGPLLHADAVGTGCIVIRRDVLEQMQWPYFEIIQVPGEPIQGEDFVFWGKVGGVAVLRDYRCQHFRDVDLSRFRELTDYVGEVNLQLKEKRDKLESKEIHQDAAPVH